MAKLNSLDLNLAAHTGQGLAFDVAWSRKGKAKCLGNRSPGMQRDRPAMMLQPQSEAMLSVADARAVDQTRGNHAWY